MFKRICPRDPECGSGVKSLKPEAINGNTSRRTNDLEEGLQGTAGVATAIVQVFISSQAYFLMRESTSYLLKSTTWTADLSPLLLSTTGYCWKAVGMSAQQVGAPSTKMRTFVACVENHPSTEKRLISRIQLITLGEFIGREGSYSLNRKQGEQRIFLFEDPISSLTRGHILGEKQPSSGYQPHPSDVSPLEDAHVSPREFRQDPDWFGRLHLPTHTLSERHCHPPRRLHPGRDDANCSNLSSCHGCTTESSHNSTGLGTVGIVM